MGGSVITGDVKTALLIDLSLYRIADSQAAYNEKPLMDNYIRWNTNGIGDSKPSSRTADFAGISHLSSHLPIEGRSVQYYPCRLPRFHYFSFFAINQELYDGCLLRNPPSAQPAAGRH